METLDTLQLNTIDSSNHFISDEDPKGWEFKVFIKRIISLTSEIAALVTLLP